MNYGIVFFLLLPVALAQSPTCNDVRSVLAAKDCCQITADADTTVDEFVWRECTITRECEDGQTLIWKENAWECGSKTGRRLHDDDSIEEILRRIRRLEDLLST